MIKHIVFFGIADGVDGKTKSESAEFIKSELENLINLIPVLRKIEVGLNAADAPQDNFDLSLYTEFDSMADLDAYQVHPEHKRVAALIAKVKTARACVDYYC